MKQRTVVWKQVDDEGIEYLTLREGTWSIQIESVVIAFIHKNAFRLDYQIHCGADFAVREVNMVEAIRGRLHLSTDGSGNWFDKGKSLPEFEGCIDVDIMARPFTNTLPIRRINWQAGQSEDFRILYISVPELTLSVSNQRYTCLEKTAEGGLFRFELIDGDFTALLSVDADGLVIDYPGLFRRVYASGWAEGAG